MATSINYYKENKNNTPKFRKNKISFAGNQITNILINHLNIIFTLEFQYFQVFISIMSNGYEYQIHVYMFE